MASDTAQDIICRKVANIADLSSAEREAISRLPILLRDVPARTDVVGEGEVPTHCCLVVAGLMIRYKLISSGQRQIVNLHVLGDIPDLQSLHLSVMDHHLATLTPTTIGMIPHAALRRVSETFPRIASALWRVTLIDAALLRERVVTMGQRTAVQRVAHLLCEMFLRLRAIGQADGQVMTLHLAQWELADLLGMSTVHVNRMMQDLRARNLIATEGHDVFFRNWQGLADLGSFDPLYLHLGPEDRVDPP